MTDEAWPRGWHLSLSWFWLVWHHGAVYWSMVHGKEVILSNVHQHSCCPFCYACVCFRGSFDPQRALLSALPLISPRSHPVHFTWINTWLNNSSQRWAKIFVGTLYLKATYTYIQMSSVVCARIEKRHLGILGRGAMASLQSYADSSSNSSCPS